MSVLIKDITIDEFWEDYGEGAAYLCATGKAEEIPPHGNLIDGDKLYKDITESILLTNGFKETFKLFFDEQDIVIPGDEGTPSEKDSG